MLAGNRIRGTSTRHGEALGALGLMLLASAACTNRAGATPPPAAPALALATECGAPAPSGLWMLEPLDDSGCIDCPTPRFAVVAAAGPLDELATRASAHGGASAGYPMLVLPHELGLADRGGTDVATVLLVDGLYAERADAECRQRELGPTAAVREVDWDAARPVPLVVRLRRAAEGHDAATVREGDGEPGEAPPVCSLPEGAAFVVGESEVIRPIDAAPWVMLPCEAGLAAFRAADTDYGLLVLAGGNPVVEWQDAGGVCGVRYYARRSVDDASADGEVSLGTDRCFGEPAGDAWGVCPGGTLDGCLRRAEELRAGGRDPRRAARLAAYACSWGAVAACRLRWGIDLVDRGVPVADVLFRAVAECDADPGEGEGSELCAAAEELLRSFPAERLRDASDADRGFVGRFGCLHDIPGYCELLESSETCDLDGCG